MTSADAKALAAIEHAGQRDKGGHAYMGHVERVAAGAEWRARAALESGLPVDVDQVVQAAWLHDIVEDTPLTLVDLSEDGFTPEVVAMVDLLTKPTGPGTYAEKLQRLLRAGNLGALLVKLADNEDNASPERTLPSGHLLVRYAAARTRLLRAAAELGYVEA